MVGCNCQCHVRASSTAQRGVRQATQGPRSEHGGDPHDWWTAICRQEVPGSIPRDFPVWMTSAGDEGRAWNREERTHECLVPRLVE